MFEVPSLFGNQAKLVGALFEFVTDAGSIPAKSTHKGCIMTHDKITRDVVFNNLTIDDMRTWNIPKNSIHFGYNPPMEWVNYEIIITANYNNDPIYGNERMSWNSRIMYGFKNGAEQLVPEYKYYDASEAGGPDGWKEVLKGACHNIMDHYNGIIEGSRMVTEKRKKEQAMLDRVMQDFI